MVVKVLTLSRLGLFLCFCAVTALTICFLIKTESELSLYIMVDLDVKKTNIYVYAVTYEGKEKLHHPIKNVACGSLVTFSLKSGNSNYSNITRDVRYNFNACLRNTFNGIRPVEILKSVMYVGTSGKFFYMCRQYKTCKKLQIELRYVLDTYGYKNDSYVIEFLTPEMRSFYGFLGWNTYLHAYNSSQYSGKLINYLHYYEEDIYISYVKEGYRSFNSLGITKNITFMGKIHRIFSQGKNCGGFDYTRILYEIYLIQLRMFVDPCLPKDYKLSRNVNEYHTGCVGVLTDHIDFNIPTYTFTGTGEYKMCFKSFENAYAGCNSACLNTRYCIGQGFTCGLDENITGYVTYQPFNHKLGLNEKSTISDYLDLIDKRCYAEQAPPDANCFYYLFGYYVLNQIVYMRNNDTKFITHRPTIPEWIEGQITVVSELELQNVHERLIDLTIYLCLLMSIWFFLTLFLVMSVKDWLRGKYHIQHV